MKIFGVLWRNLWHGPMTLRFPKRPPVTQGYRGLVHFDPERCTGCAMCRFRCTARAITFNAAKTEYTWSYDPGRCTFCGRCVDGCKDHALTQDAACPPIYEQSGSLKQSYTLQRKPPAAKTLKPNAPAGTQPASAGGEL